MIQDFHKTKAVFIFFKDVLSVDPSDHDMIDVGYALSSCDPRHADHPETVYHAGSREEKQKRNEKGRPYRSERITLSGHIQIRPDYGKIYAEDLWYG